MPSRIYLIPTVLAENTANDVLPLQVIDAIRHLDVFLVENLRTARRFISSLKLGKVIDELTLYEVTKDTTAKEIEDILKKCTGLEIGIISEAGCPGIADPGAEVVKIAHKRSIPVIPLVGPSSILLALMASGFSGQSFVFHGYLPIEKDGRQKALKQMELDAIKKRQTQLFMETPYRNQSLFDDVLKTLQPNTLVSVAAEITGAEQFIATKTVAEWKKQIPVLHKRPVIFGIFTN